MATDYRRPCVGFNPLPTREHSSMWEGSLRGRAALLTDETNANILSKKVSRDVHQRVFVPGYLNYGLPMLFAFRNPALKLISETEF